jgi:hypothetical protein
VLELAYTTGFAVEHFGIIACPAVLEEEDVVAALAAAVSSVARVTVMIA